MTDIEKKALALVNEVLAEWGVMKNAVEIPKNSDAFARALLRAIEQHEAFRREVSEAVDTYLSHMSPWPDDSLRRFIIPKPVDPLVEALREAGEQTGGQVSNERLAHDLRAAMKARGYEFTKIGDAV